MSDVQLPSLRDIPDLDDRLIRFLEQLNSNVSILLQLHSENRSAISDTSGKIPQAAQITNNLQAHGSNPLNVEALRGKLGESQPASAPSLSALPSLSDPQYDDGYLIAVTQVVYRRNRTTEPGSWDKVSADTSVPQSANKVYAGPTTGAAATPTFRSLVDADIPAEELKTDDAFTKVIAGAPYVNDGYVTIKDHNGHSVRVMTTA